MTPLERALRKRIEAEGPITRRSLYGSLQRLLLRDPRSARRGRRFHHRAGNQPDVRRDGRRRARRLLDPRRRAGGCDLCRARAGPRDAGGRRAAGDARRRASPAKCISSRPARCCARSSGNRTRTRAWHDSAREPAARRPLLLVANEFLDALPVRQFVGGIERRMSRSPPAGLAFDRDGEIVEDSPVRDEAVAGDRRRCSTSAAASP